MIYLTLLLIVYISIKEYLHHKERQDLYDRIMAKDFTEYKSRGDPPHTIKNIIRKNMSKGV